MFVNVPEPFDDGLFVRAEDVSQITDTDKSNEIIQTTVIDIIQYRFRICIIGFFLRLIFLQDLFPVCT